MAYTTYNFNNAKNDLKYLIRDPSFGRYGESYIDQALDQMHTQIIMGDQWRFAQALDTSISLSANENTFTLPEDFDSTDSTKFFLYHTSINRDNKISYLQGGNPPDSTSKGEPLVWYIYANQAYVYPLANKNYTLILKYYKKPISISVDQTTLLIPVSHAEILPYAVACKVLPANDPNYGKCEAKYNELYNDMVFKFSALSEDNRQDSIIQNTYNNDRFW